MSGLNTGLAAQFGVGEESTHGTKVAPSRHHEFLDESLTMDQARIESQALAAGRYTTRSFALGRKTVGGAVNFELADKGFGLLLKHALGAVATTQPDAVNSPTVYLHTFTPGTLPEGLTLQVGRPDVNGTVLPFDYTGCMVGEWSLDASVGELVKASFTFDGQDELTGGALAPATIPDPLGLLVFTGATLSVGAQEVAVNAASVKGANGLGTDRVRLGSVLRKKPTQGRREWTGEFAAEFDGLTQYNHYRNGDEVTLTLNMQGGVIEDALTAFCKVTLNVRFDGSTPTVGGPDEVPHNVSFKVVDSVAQSVQVEYQTADATP